MLQRFNAVINVGSCFVTFNEASRIPFIKEDSPPFISEVKVSQTHVIDANCEALIPGYLETASSTPVIGLIEANQSLSDRHNLFGASILACPAKDGQVSIRLINPSDSPVLLHKDTIFRSFVEIALEDVIIPVGPEPVVTSVETALPQSVDISRPQPLLMKTFRPAQIYRNQRIPG